MKSLLGMDSSYRRECARVASISCLSTSNAGQKRDTQTQKPRKKCGPMARQSYAKELMLLPYVKLIWIPQHHNSPVREKPPARESTKIQRASRSFHYYPHINPEVLSTIFTKQLRPPFKNEYRQDNS